MRRLGEFANGGSLSQFSSSPLQGLWGDGGVERSSSSTEKFSPGMHCAADAGFRPQAAAP